MVLLLGLQKAIRGLLTLGRSCPGGVGRNSSSFFGPGMEREKVLGCQLCLSCAGPLWKAREMAHTVPGMETCLQYQVWKHLSSHGTSILPGQQEPFSLSPKTCMRGIQDHSLNTRKQNDFLHSPIALLGLWGRTLNLSLAHRWGQSSPSLFHRAMHVQGEDFNPLKTSPPAWPGGCKPPTLVRAVCRNPQDEEH